MKYDATITAVKQITATSWYGSSGIPPVPVLDVLLEEDDVLVEKTGGLEEVELVVVWELLVVFVTTVVVVEVAAWRNLTETAFDVKAVRLYLLSTILLTAYV